MLNGKTGDGYSGGYTYTPYAPAVADHPALREVEAEGGGGVEQHARRGFAAAVGRVVDALAGCVADFDARDLRDEFSQVGMHDFHIRQRLRAAADIGLVGGDDQNVTGGVEAAAGFRRIRIEDKFLEGGRRVRLPRLHHRDVQRAVAVEEDGGTEAGGGS